MTPSETVRALRALLFSMPMAVLVGAIFAPPDAVAQALVIGVALAVGWPLTYRLHDTRVLSAGTIAAFYLVVLGLVLAGLWALSTRTVCGGVAALVAKAAVVAVATVVADRFVFAWRDG
ncbi:MAG: hypothetical protein ABEJ67_05400 [Halanaeroarchaeum sp.]